MSRNFEIIASTGTYGIAIGQGILADALAVADDALILCDQRFAGQLSPSHPVIDFTAAEEAKSLAGVSEIVARMREARATRNTLLWAIGGGVIQDVATLSAALYMRGIPWRYVPTTLLAMVDSCIGGKSAINVGTYKNLVGNFYPPTGIIIDTSFIGSLNTEQLAAGLCEAAKICFARGDGPFDRFLAMAGNGQTSDIDWPAVIEESLLAKKWFVETDEFDRKERLLLNFGHTFGHAIEGASHYRISHGIAVGLGMLAADVLAQRLARYQQRPVRLTRLLDYLRPLLAQAVASDTLHDLDPETTFGCFEADKKHQRDQYAAILPDQDGHLERVLLDKTPENQACIKQAFSSIASLPA